MTHMSLASYYPEGSMHRAIIAIMIFIISMTGAYAMNADFYVSPQGDDGWSGTLPAPNEMRNDGPFATVQRAQKAVRAMKPPKLHPAYVLLREGTYEITSPLSFGPEDSYTTYAAYPGEKPIISGGRHITGWKKSGDVWTATIPSSWYFRDMYLNGQRRSRTRLPKEDFFHLESLGQDVRNAFRYKEDDIKTWGNLEDVEVIAFNAWDELRFHIKSIDEKEHVITFTGSNNWPFECWGQANSRYYVENAPVPLEPGQWYLDRQSGVVTYRPLPGENIKRAEFIAPVIDRLVLVDGNDKQPVEHFNLKGLSFRYAGWDLPKESYISIQAAVKIPGVIGLNLVRDCAVTDCDISRVGQYGIEIGTGTSILVKGNTIHDMGAGGIKLHAGDHNLITRNHIYDLGHTYPSAVGVWVGNSGHNMISCNHIHDLFYTGISVGWNWGYGPTKTQENIIEHNHIHNIGRGLLSDMGGIYTLGVSDGTVIRYNLIHDVQSFNYGGWGIYLDEGSTHMLVENNIVYRVKTGGFHQHYGKENIIRNNIFAFSKQGQIQRTRQEGHLSFTFEHNVVVWDEGVLFTGNWDDPATYKIDNNIYWALKEANWFDTYKGTQFTKWQQPGRDEHSMLVDPQFLDPAHGDFRLSESSPVEKLGFKPIVGAGDKLCGVRELVLAVLNPRLGYRRDLFLGSRLLYQAREQVHSILSAQSPNSGNEFPHSISVSTCLYCPATSVAAGRRWPSCRLDRLQ